MIPNPLTPRVECLPLSEMPWERFEAFAHDLFSRLPEYSNCHRYGVPGQKQDGIDLIADDIAGRRWAFSIKRYERYHPSNARQHIADTTYPAFRYVLLLSRDVSATVQDEVAKHPSWEVWGAAELCQRVRELRAQNPESARELIDYHFGPMWRKDFLGLPAVSAFLAPDDHFREFLDTSRLFHHGYGLVGRSDVVESLVRFTSSAARIAILPGRGGIGKTRLLRAVAGRVLQGDVEPAVRFWVEGVPVADGALDELPNKPCLVLVDDAHRRDDVGRLLAFARRRTDLKVILTARPFGLGGLRGCVTRAGFDARETVELPPLTPLSRSDVLALARDALGPAWGQREEVVGRLTRATRDCPLVTVIGGRLIAERAIAPEQLAHDETFRRQVFDRFADELVGRLSSTFPAESVRRVLECLAAINPTPVRDDAVYHRLARSVDARVPDIVRLVAELEQAGVLARRGNGLRIVPDVFADHLLAVACLTPANEPTGFADQVFADFDDLRPEPVLRNLAELDWRVRSSGGEARLLDRLWDGITRRFENGSSSERFRILGLVSEAADYQPDRVLMLARMAVELPASPEPSDAAWHTDADVLAHLPELLLRCSCTPNVLPACLDLVWRIALRETRSDLPAAEAAFRVLGELSGYEHWKPLSMNAAAARAARRWARAPEAMPHRMPILRVIEPLLAKSGMDVWAEGPRFCHVAFLVPADGVRGTRRDVFAVLREYLAAGDVPLQLRVLACVQSALNGPMPMGGVAATREDLAAWGADQLELLGLLTEFLATGRPAVIQLRVFEAVRYQAAHGFVPAVQTQAAAVAALVEDSFEVRVARLLLSRLARQDTWEADKGEPPSLETLHARHGERHVPVAEEVWRLNPDAALAFSFLDVTVRCLREVDPEVDPRHLLWYLLAARPAEAIAFTRLVIANPTSPLAESLATCLAHARRTDATATAVLARLAVESGYPALAAGASNHYRWDWLPGERLTDADAEAVRLLVSSPDPNLREGGLGALHHLARDTHRAAVELALGVEVGGDVEVGEELARLTDPTQPASLAAELSDYDIRLMLRKFDALPRVGYWVCALVRRVVGRMPDEVLDFFFRRVEGMRGYAGNFDAVPDRHGDDVFAPLAGHKRLDELVRRVRDQALTAARWQLTPLALLFRSVSMDFNPDGLAALREWLAGEDSARVELAVLLLAGADADFLFEQSEFVKFALERAGAINDECLNRVRSALMRIAHHLERQGPAGQPFPQDIAQRDRADETLQRLTPGTEAHRFYESVRRGALDRIRAEEESDGWED